MKASQNFNFNLYLNFLARVRLISKTRVIASTDILQALAWLNTVIMTENRIQLLLQCQKQQNKALHFCRITVVGMFMTGRNTQGTGKLAAIHLLTYP